MDPTIVLIACKVAYLPFANPIDEANYKYTHYRPYEWAIESSQMHCKRHEVQVYNPSDPKEEFDHFKCMKASWQLRMQWDMSHTHYKVWKTACPTPIIDLETGRVLAWKLPECPRENKQAKCAVHCEQDIRI